MFSPDTHLLEIVARTFVVYLALLVVLRLAGKRELGQMTPFDLVVLLLISEAVQNALIGGDESLTGGLIAAAMLIGTNYAVAAVRDRIPWLREMVEGSPTVVVSKGRFQRQNMKKEGIDEEEVMMAARQQGIADIGKVKLAVLETDGSISVVPDSGNEGDDRPKRRRRRRLFQKR
jgi:uncharacterized membrane protein YcaP (DUF421 family)